METLGMMLYRLYQDAFAKQSISTDGWDTLDETDKIAWEEAAQGFVKEIAADKDLRPDPDS